MGFGCSHNIIPRREFKPYSQGNIKTDLFFCENINDKACEPHKRIRPSQETCLLKYKFIMFMRLENKNLISGE